MSQLRNAVAQSCEAIQESHSAQVNNRLHFITDRLEVMENRLEGQLESILVPLAPCEPAKDKSNPPQRRPLLFAELHANLDALELRIADIIDIMDRIEL